MSRYPQVTVTRRSPVGGGTVPAVMKPGELFMHIDTGGMVALYGGDPRGTPQLITGGGGGGGGGGATVPTAKPNNPSAGDLWYDVAANALNIYDGLAAAWKQVFDDTDLLRHDGTRPVTGAIDMDGNDLTDAGAVTASQIDGAVISGGSF